MLHTKLGITHAKLGIFHAPNANRDFLLGIARATLGIGIANLGIGAPHSAGGVNVFGSQKIGASQFFFR